MSQAQNLETLKESEVSLADLVRLSWRLPLWSLGEVRAYKIDYEARCYQVGLARSLFAWLLVPFGLAHELMYARKDRLSVRYVHREILNKVVWKIGVGGEYMRWKRQCVRDFNTYMHDHTEQALPAPVANVVDSVRAVEPRAMFFVEAFGTDPILIVERHTDHGKEVCYALIWDIGKDNEVVYIDPPSKSD